MAEPRFVVRPATVADIGGIQDVAYETWRATYRGHIPDADIEAFLSANYSLEQLTRSVSRLGNGLLVACHGDEVVGYAMLSENGQGEAELWTIYVLPTFHGQGAGKLLWDAALDHARELGLQTLVLWVLKDNMTARRFYERQGAKPFAEREYPVGDLSILETGYRLSLT